MAGLAPAAAQDVHAVLADAARATGSANLESITYSGSAAIANFGRTISFGLASTAIRNYTRTIDFSSGTSRVTGFAASPPAHGGPPGARIHVKRLRRSDGFGWRGGSRGNAR